MTKIAIISYVANESSRNLASALRLNGMEATAFNMKNTSKSNFREFDWVFSYGCSQETFHHNRINSKASVLKCVDKPATFDALHKARVNTVEYCLRKKDIPKSWDWVTIRDEVNGRKAEGLYFQENTGIIRDGKLFSEYFENRYEYRIMVFMGKVVGRYYKREKGKEWHFNPQPAKGFEMMDDHCIRGAKALGIDYVGFDVVANKSKKDFRILEANSGPIITDEASKAIVLYFLNL